MSRADVGIVIDKLLTDETLRVRFALDPIETVANLCLRGAELTRDEVELFAGPMRGCGALGEDARGEWQH